MTKQPTPGQPSYEQLLADAVRVLTTAARRVVTWTDAEGREHTRQADWAEFVTHAVAGAAANVGGIEEALAGRGGSWEADYVRQMLHSTVGADEQYLFEHRTEPLVITVAVDNLLTDLGFSDLYDQAHLALDRSEQDICERVEQQHGEVKSVEDVPVEDQAALDELDRLHQRLDRLRDQDWADYGRAFKTNALAAAAELFPTPPVPVHVEVQLDWRPDQDDSGARPWGPAFAVWERARQLTPLPGGRLLKDCPTLPAALVEREHAAGRDPLTRLTRDDELGRSTSGGGDRA